jgi:BlaI family transcriptional regulator, penicillinase repressor
MGELVKISDSEWEVMNVVWEAAPVSALAIVEKLSRKKKWHSRTIRTLLDRLVKKRALTFVAEGKRYLYRAKIGREICVRRASRSLLERVFGGEPASMLIHLVQNTDLSGEDIKKLKRILSEKEKE